MKRILPLLMVIIALALAVLGGRATSAQDKQDKYTLQVPGGLAFSDFKGYEDWQAVGPSLTDASNVIRLIVANPVMIDAYKEGVPGNGKLFPDGSKIAKIVWTPKKLTDPPFSASTPDTVPGDLIEVELIERDNKRFSDTHGWDMPCSTMTPHPVGSRRPPRPASRRRDTTPNAAPHATS